MLLSQHFRFTADGQIEGSEFVANVGTLQKMSLLGHCNRFRITITISFGK